MSRVWHHPVPTSLKPAPRAGSTLSRRFSRAGVAEKKYGDTQMAGRNLQKIRTVKCYHICIYIERKVEVRRKKNMVKIPLKQTYIVFTFKKCCRCPSPLVMTPRW